MADRFTYRPALDGLRAVAVLAVLIYHVHEPWLPGGFLGVDIFFVLSGYLITSLLIIEHRSTGRIRLSRFWSRRARRLLPAILILIVVVAVVENQTISAAALRATRRSELLATLFYFANWFFVFTDVSYFTDFAGASPVRHTWSLAIEEQFYLLFPLLMYGGLRLKGRRLTTVMTAVLIGSGLLMAWLFEPSDPSRAYYGTDTRIHQLVAGAILAWLLAGPAREAIVRTAKTLMPVAVVLLASALLLMRDDGVFYYRGGAVAIGLLTVALVAGLEQSSALQRGLINRPMVAIGKISYGMYLWHFPLIIWLTKAGLQSPAGLLTATLASTIGIAAASYVLVERPIRVDKRVFGFDLTPQRLAAVVPLVSVSTALIVFAALPDSLPVWAREGAATADAPVNVVAAPTTVPDTAPPSADADPSTTTLGSDPPKLAIVGDSFMVSAQTGFREAAGEFDVVLVEAAFPACPVGREPLANLDGTDHFKAEECVRLTTDAYQWLMDHPVDVVVWHDLQSVLPRFADDGTVLVPGTAEWQQDLLTEWRVVLDDLLGQSTTVAILLPPLRSQDADCAAAENEGRCNDILSQDRTIREATEAFQQATAGLDGVFFLDIDDLLCPGGLPCPATIGGLTVREGGTDQTHFTEEGAFWFAERIIPRVLALAQG